MRTCTALFLLLLLAGPAALAQPNSVHLYDGGGALVGQHPSISAAYAAVPDPLTQRYLIELQSSYNASSETIPIVLGVKGGSSDVNTVTIRPAAGVTGKVITAALTTAVLSFDDADYVILDGRPGGAGTASELTIQNSNTSGTSANTIHFLNGATFNTVQYVRTINGTAGSAGPRNIAFGLCAVNITGNSDNRILHCVIEGGRTGVGSQGTAANPNRRNLVYGSDIKDWGYAGVWMQAATDGMTLDSNDIHQAVGENITNPSGISLNVSTPYTATVTRNRVYDIRATSTSTSLTIRAIHTFSGPGAGSVLTIENNFISLVQDNANAASVYGILLTGLNDYTANVRYNSVLIGGTHAGGTAGRVVSAGLVKRTSGAGAACNIRNNIFRNDRTGGTPGVIHTGGAVDSVAGILDIDRNAHWAAAGGGTHAVWATLPYTDLGTYKTAASPSEANAVFYGAEFVGTPDLHLTGGSIGNPDLQGEPIAGVLMDIDAEPRSPISPYKGADEVIAGTIWIPVSLLQGWNLVANPVTAPNDSMRALFPSSAFPYAFGFAGSSGYVSAFRLENGTGYWGKWADDTVEVVGGSPVYAESILVSPGWNLVGTISDTVDTAGIPASPPDLRTSPWYGYGPGGYFEATELIPGCAYWVKAREAGRFYFSASAAAVRPAAPERRRGH
ncbi:MAG: hypothetical protein WB626_01960 [Bacteroidota bacterium]